MVQILEFWRIKRKELNKILFNQVILDRIQSVKVEVNRSLIIRWIKTVINMLIPIRLTCITKRPTTVLFSKVISISQIQKVTQFSAKNSKKGIKIIKCSQWMHSLCKLMQIIPTKIHSLHSMIFKIREHLLNLLWRIEMVIILEIHKTFSILLSISRSIPLNKFNCLLI